MQRVALAALIFISLFGSRARAEIIDGYMPARHDLFNTGTYPNTSVGMPPVPNPTFYLNVYDFSGVGWVPTAATGTKNVAMISPRHFVCATHFPLGPGTTVAFRAKDGSYLTRTVATQTQIAGTDVMVGELDSNLPTGATGVAVYPIPVGSAAQFAGQQMFMVGQQGRVGRNLIWDTTTSADVGTGSTVVARTDYDPNFNLDGRGYAPPITPPAMPPTDELVFQSGDSGSPSFLPIGNQLSLIGAHQALLTIGGTPAGTTDSFLNAYIGQLSTELSMDGFTLNTIPVPEPGSMVLTAFGVLAGVRYLRRRRTSS
jgi:hypothetical protein